MLLPCRRGLRRIVLTVVSKISERWLTNMQNKLSFPVSIGDLEHEVLYAPMENRTLVAKSFLACIKASITRRYKLISTRVKDRLKVRENSQPFWEPRRHRDRSRSSLFRKLEFSTISCTIEVDTRGIYAPEKFTCFIADFNKLGDVLSKWIYVVYYCEVQD